MTLFRDTYKAANNDIKPDSKLLAQTLSRIEEGKKRTVIPFRAIGTCAAALLVAVGSVYGYVRYTDATTLRIAPEIVRVDTDPDNALSDNSLQTADTSQEQTESIQSTPDNSDTALAETKKVRTSEEIKSKETGTKALNPNTAITDKTIENKSREVLERLTEDTAEAMPAQTDAPDADTDTGTADMSSIADVPMMASEPVYEEYSSPVAPMQESIDENTETFKMTADTRTVSGSSGGSSGGGMAGGGGGSARVSSSSASAQPTHISYNDYCKYIGADLFAKLRMPEGMTADRWNTAPFSKENDEVTFSYSDNSKSAYVKPTLNKDRIYALIDSCPATDKTSVFASVYGKDHAYAYIISGSAGYTVNCYGFEKQEFTQLIDSILN